MSVATNNNNGNIPNIVYFPGPNTVPTMNITRETGLIYHNFSCRDFFVML